LQGSRIANTITTNKGARNMTKTFEIVTLETVPVIKKFVYTLEAESKEEAERNFLNNKNLFLDDCSYIKEVDCLEVTETEIQEIREVE
jgi:hypothetical protein